MGMATAKQNTYTVVPGFQPWKWRMGCLQDHVSFSMGSFSTSISTEKKKWKVSTPPKTNMDTQNDVLEKVYIYNSL